VAVDCLVAASNRSSMFEVGFRVVDHPMLFTDQNRSYENQQVPRGV